MNKLRSLEVLLNVAVLLYETSLLIRIAIKTCL